jgi:hypothetical protein
MTNKSDLDFLRNVGDILINSGTEEIVFDAQLLILEAKRHGCTAAYFPLHKKIDQYDPQVSYLTVVKALRLKGIYPKRHEPDHEPWGPCRIDPPNVICCRQYDAAGEGRQHPEGAIYFEHARTKVMLSLAHSIPYTLLALAFSLLFVLLSVLLAYFDPECIHFYDEEAFVFATWCCGCIVVAGVIHTLAVYYFKYTRRIQ